VKSLHCDVAVLLNMSPDHLDRHGGMEGYQAAKMRIFQNQQKGDVAIVGFDDVITQSIAIGLAGHGPGRVVHASSTYTLGRGVSAIDGRLYDNQSGKAELIGNLADCPSLPGKHNHQNAAAAYAACRALGIEQHVIMAGLKTFPGLPHRLETVGEVDGVRFVNDSKATNAQAAEQALRAFKNVYWIAGGVPKADGIEPLESLFPNVAKAYLIGDAETAFAATLKGKVALQKCGTLEKAVEAALRDARASGEDAPIVLLSPACASFDQFQDFEHRGDVFRSIVQAMMPNEIRVTA
jgi:UDP-N-acetylmuramoylalanine--D-glutamate ligase